MGGAEVQGFGIRPLWGPGLWLASFSSLPVGWLHVYVLIEYL